MYTIDGTEVSVVKKIEEGYLANPVYSYYNSYDDEDQSEIEEMSNEVIFYEKLYEKPPTEKYLKEVIDLKEEAERLNSEILELRKTRNEEKATIGKVSKYPFINGLLDYLSGNYSFAVYDKDLEIVARGKFYETERVKVVNLKDKGWILYKLRSESSDSFDDYSFAVFNTMDEVLEYCRKWISKKIEFWKTVQYWNARDLEAEIRKISYSHPAKKDEKFMEIYSEGLQFFKERERKATTEKLKKEIAELEKKRSQLEALK